MSFNADTFPEGFRFAESKRQEKARAVSKVRPFLSQFTSGDVVLDAGCGFGIELNVVSSHVEHSVGLDIDPFNLRAARNFLYSKSENIDLIRADIFSLPFKASSFSKIICFDVLEHLSSPKKAIKELKRILTAEGECFIRVPNKWREFLLMILSKLRRSNKALWNVRHVSFFSFTEIVKTFIDEGFSYIAGYTTGSFISNVLTLLLTFASVLLNIIFHHDYYKNRYYFEALCTFHPRSYIYFIKKFKGTFPRMPLFCYFTMVFRYH